jgi:hypothetical protein
MKQTEESLKAGTSMFTILVCSLFLLLLGLLVYAALECHLLANTGFFLEKPTGLQCTWKQHFF